jgi:transposase InsO family protein
MTKDDVLFGYRLQLFDLAGRTTVAHACRTFGVHRSTYYAWKKQVDRSGLQMLRPRERRRPQMPTQLPAMIEQRILSFAIAHPGLGPKRVAAELAREKWGGIVVSPNGVYKVLCRHGLNTRAKRLALVAGYAAPYEPPRDPGPEQHIDVDRPGELVGIDCFYVGRLRGTEGAIWQLTAIDIASSFAWAELVMEKGHTVSARNTSRFARRVAAELKAAGWRLERVLSDNGNEFKGDFTTTLERLRARHSRIHAGRPQTNGNVEALHKTILDECWRPAFARYLYPRLAGLRRELDTYLNYYNYDRVHHGRLTRGQIPADIVYGARKMEPS